MSWTLGQGLNVRPGWVFILCSWAKHWQCNSDRACLHPGGKLLGRLMIWLYLKVFDENDSIVELIFTIHIHHSLSRSCRKIPRRTCQSRNSGSKTTISNTELNYKAKANWFPTINLILLCSCYSRILVSSSIQLRKEKRKEKKKKKKANSEY